MNNYTICPCCGQKIVEYKHKMNQRLVSGLSALYRVGGESTLQDLQEVANLTYSEVANFQKLRHFGLVEKVNGSHIYRITANGRSFIEGRGFAPSYVITQNNAVVGKGDPISVREVVEPSQSVYEIQCEM